MKSDRPAAPQLTYRERIPAAPHLTPSGNCSDCGVPHVLAGEGCYKVCPKCYCVLWHYDWFGKEKKLEEARRKQLEKTDKERRAAKLAELTKKKEESEKKPEEPPPKPDSVL